MFIGLIYLIWPIFGKWSGAPGFWVGTLACFGTFLASLALSARAMSKAPIGNVGIVFGLLLVGFINGLAVYLYSIKSTDPTVPTGLFVTTVCISMVVGAPVVDYTLNHQAISGRQMLGIAMAIGSIFLISRK